MFRGSVPISKYVEKLVCQRRKGSIQTRFSFLNQIVVIKKIGVFFDKNLTSPLSRLRKEG